MLHPSVSCQKNIIWLLNLIDIHKSHIPLIYAYGIYKKHNIASIYILSVHETTDNYVTVTTSISMYMYIFISTSWFFCTS